MHRQIVGIVRYLIYANHLHTAWAIISHRNERLTNIKISMLATIYMYISSIFSVCFVCRNCLESLRCIEGHIVDCHLTILKCNAMFVWALHTHSTHTCSGFVYILWDVVYCAFCNGLIKGAHRVRNADGFMVVLKWRVLFLCVFYLSAFCLEVWTCCIFVGYFNLEQYKDVTFHCIVMLMRKCIAIVSRTDDFNYRI